MDHSQPLFFFIFVFSIQLVVHIHLPMTGFELQNSGVRSDCSNNCATTTVLCQQPFGQFLVPSATGSVRPLFCHTFVKSAFPHSSVDHRVIYRLTVSTQLQRCRPLNPQHYYQREPWSSGMGGVSCSEGRWFESKHLILDGHFVTCFCGKNCSVCLK